MMVNKFFLLAILFVFVFLASGCTVARGTTGAIGGLTTGALEGGREGFKEDVESINKVNNWVKDNQGV
ncbi:MAG: hypothetical protein PHG87_03445, partial [Candidatus Omnitrophica bacterium]|nr:hypothetical protein [Candidatus Omnitrophota bacterium]